MTGLSKCNRHQQFRSQNKHLTSECYRYSPLETKIKKSKVELPHRKKDSVTETCKPLCCNSKKGDGRPGGVHNTATTNISTMYRHSLRCIGEPFVEPGTSAALIRLTSSQCRQLYISFVSHLLLTLADVLRRRCPPPRHRCYR